MAFVIHCGAMSGPNGCHARADDGFVHVLVGVAHDGLRSLETFLMGGRIHWLRFTSEKSIPQ